MHRTLGLLMGARATGSPWTRPLPPPVRPCRNGAGGGTGAAAGETGAAAGLASQLTEGEFDLWWSTLESVQTPTGNLPDRDHDHKHPAVDAPSPPTSPPWAAPATAPSSRQDEARFSPFALLHHHLTTITGHVGSYIEPLVERRYMAMWLIPLIAMLVGSHHYRISLWTEVEEGIEMLLMCFLTFGLYNGTLAALFPSELSSAKGRRFLLAPQLLFTTITAICVGTDLYQTSVEREVMLDGSRIGLAYTVLHIAFSLGCLVTQCLGMWLVWTRRMTWQAWRLTQALDGLCCMVGQLTCPPTLYIGVVAAFARGSSTPLASAALTPTNRQYLAGLAKQAGLLYATVEPAPEEEEEEEERRRRATDSIKPALAPPCDKFKPALAPPCDKFKPALEVSCDKFKPALAPPCDKSTS